MLDTDGSGDITKAELVQGLQNDPRLKHELSAIMGSEDPLEIFEMLDVDDSDSVSIDEFCEHCLKAVSSDKHIMELARIMKFLKQLN